MTTSLLQQLCHEIRGNKPYIQKIMAWLDDNDKHEFHTNLFDIEKNENGILIYSVLDGKLQPENSTKMAFIQALLNSQNP